MPALATKPGRILAIDYGRRRMGLALSDELHLTAQPLMTMLRKNRRDDLRRLREMVRDHGVTQIIVGHPLRLDGEESEMGAEAAAFAKRVARALGVPMQLYDERLTSWEAEQMVAEKDGQTGRHSRPVKHSTRRGHSSARSARPAKDHLAAAILLHDYLESRRARHSGKS